MGRSIQSRINVNIMVINRVISASKVNKRKGAKPQGRKERCIASSKHSFAEASAFSSHDPLVQQPAGQLPMKHKNERGELEENR